MPPLISELLADLLLISHNEQKPLINEENCLHEILASNTVSISTCRYEYPKRVESSTWGALCISRMALLSICQMPKYQAVSQLFMLFKTHKTLKKQNKPQYSLGARKRGPQLICSMIGSLFPCKSSK